MGCGCVAAYSYTSRRWRGGAVPKTLVAVGAFLFYGETAVTHIAPCVWRGIGALSWQTARQRCRSIDRIERIGSKESDRLERPMSTCHCRTVYYFYWRYIIFTLCVVLLIYILKCVVLCLSYPNFASIGSVTIT